MIQEPTRLRVIRKIYIALKSFFIVRKIDSFDYDFK